MFRVVVAASLIFGLIPSYCFSQSRDESAVAQPPNQNPDAVRETASPARAAEGATSAASAASVPSMDGLNSLVEATILYRKGDFAGAIAKYQLCLQQNPKSPDAYAGLVHVYLRQKNIEEAAQAAEKGLAQSDAARIHVARGEVWFRQGKINDAEKEWVNVIKSGHPEARAYLGLARVRNAIAMYKSAKAMIDKAHELDPNDPDIQKQWANTLSRAERIRYLRDSLARENNWSADERESTANYLEYLREREKQNKGSCRLVSKLSDTETPLVRLMVDPQHLRGYGLAVLLNGHKSSLMLDTGASGIVVKRAIAEHAGISKITANKIWGIGDKGMRSGFVGVADSIKIGELEFQNCQVSVLESRTVAEEDGLIGADVFEEFLVDIDFPNEKLKLSELPPRPGEPEQKPALKDEEDDAENANASETGQSTGDGKKETSTQAANPAMPSGPKDRYIAPEMQSYARVFRFGHDLLIPTTIGNVPYKLFLMDTGALTNFISPAAAREVTKVHGDSDMIVKGISGRVDKVYSANKAVLQFGHLKQENQEMTAFDTKAISDDIGTEVSGFLGFTTLRFLDIKIDYRDGLVDFQYDPKRWNR